MAIKGIIVASTCAAAAALALSWGFTSFGPSEPTIEIQEVPERAWRVEVEEASAQTGTDETTLPTPLE